MKKIGLAIALALTTSVVIVSCGGRSKAPPQLPTMSGNDYGAGVGAVCGATSILGKNEQSFANGACGIDNPVSVYEVSGVKLSTPAKINCKTAHALNNWVISSAKPSAAKIDKRLNELKIAASYACRNRNHKKGGKLSEHALGNAVDISGFKFTDGSELTVLDAYHQYSGYFRKVENEACGIFGTVLGPAVRLHDDHFHFDTASYSGGPYCK